MTHQAFGTIKILDTRVSDLYDSTTAMSPRVTSFVCSSVEAFACVVRLMLVLCVIVRFMMIYVMYLCLMFVLVPFLFLKLSYAFILY